MTTSSGFRDLVADVRYWIEDHAVGLVGSAMVLVLGSLMAVGIHFSLQGETYDARVTALDSSPARVVTEESCNGDPVLLICGEEEVEYPAFYTVELSYGSPATDVHQDRGDVCRQDVTAEEFAALEIGMMIPVEYRDWDGCSVKDWDTTPAS